MTQLTLRGIRKRFGSITAVDGVSLDVRPGEFVSLLGGSGSGKTTVLMTIAGFYMPDEGQIFIGDLDATEIPAYRRNLGLVYQHYALFPHMSVAKNIAFPLEMRRRPKDDIRRRVATALDLVHLGGLQDRLPGQLSGGQQQRVALARALVFEPPVLLMDEPLGALDKKLREDMQTEIKAIQRKLGITTIYVTHDQEEALTLSDRIVVMSAGRIEQVGSPEDLYERPRTPFVADFMGASNCLPATIVGGGKNVRARTAGGTLIAVDNCTDRKPGSAVSVVVRPERVQMSRTEPSAPGDWSCAGRVTTMTYVGGTLRYQIVLENGEQLAALRQNSGGDAFAPGDPVRIRWEPGDAWLIETE